jgi:hypothetical protein
MASEAQIAANRRNAQRSTGPKSAAGRARAARNSIRHGLAARVVAETPAADRGRRLADAMIGDGPRSEAIEALARVAAEAQQTIEQVNAARTLIFERPQPTVRPYRTARARKALAEIKRTVTDFSPEAAELMGKQRIQTVLDFVAFKEAEESLWLPQTESERRAVILEEVAGRLLRLERYQRRALSRRRRALNDLEGLQQAASFRK